MSNLSFIPYIGNGVTKEYGISFTGADMGYLRQSDVKVLVDGAQVSSTINPASPHLVILDEAPPVGSDVIVRREMPIETPYADFSRGNNFGYRQVNNSFLQQLYLTHELLDGFKGSGYYEKQSLNMGGFAVNNIGEPVNDNDAVRLTDIKQLSQEFNENKVSLSGGHNVMQQYLDMNNYRVLNLPAPIFPTEALRKGDVVASGLGATVEYVDGSFDFLSEQIELKVNVVYTESLPRISVYTGVPSDVVSIVNKVPTLPVNLYKDEAGTIPLPQDGESNKTDSNSNFEAYLSQGTYTITTSVGSKDFSVGLRSSAVALAVKSTVTSEPVTLQDTSDWYGIYVSQFIRIGDETISPAFNRALGYCRNLPYKGTRIIFPRGQFYKYDDDHRIGNLSHCVIDLNGSKVQRRSASTFSSTTTQIIPSGTGLNAREIYVADASKFKVGDFVYSIKGVGLDNISSDPREVISIDGNKLTIGGAFYYKGTKYGSNTDIGAIICKRVNFIGGIANSFEGDYNDKMVICNGELDGNAAGQPSQAWVFNAEIGINSNRGAIYNMTFRNTAAECIVGHGVDVHSNQFFDMGGSCFHLSVHDNSLDKTGGSWFRNNQCERTNLATQAVSGHAEGLVTFSWGAGRLVVADNICKDGTEPFLGAFGSPTEDNPDKYLVVSGNILERFPTFMSYLAPNALGVSLTDNILIETGVKPQVQAAIYANPSTKCSGNISVGSNGWPTLENVSRDERLAIGNDVQLQERQRAVISDPDAHEGLNLLYVPNPVNAQFVLQGLNTLTEDAVRVSANYKRSLYTAGGAAAGTVSEYWNEATKELGYLINPAGGSGGIFSWSTYNGGVRKHLSMDDEGASFNGMQYGRPTYYGEKDVDGSWRVMLLGGDLVHQKRVGGSWVTKQTVRG